MSQVPSGGDPSEKVPELGPEVELEGTLYDGTYQGNMTPPKKSPIRKSRTPDAYRKNPI